MSLQLRLIAAWVGTRILLAKVGKQELVMPGPLGTIHTASGDGHKMRVAFVEGSVFEEEQDILLNPHLQAPHGKQDAFGFAVARPAPVFSEASRERLFLLVGRQLGQQERMTDANFVPVESFDRARNEVDQLQPSGNEGRRLPCFCCDLFDGIGRLLQIEKRLEPLRFLHWVNVGTNQVLDLSLVRQKLSTTSTTCHFTTSWNC